MGEAARRRQELRSRGQFWTPDWIADAMVRYALIDGSDHLFDPAVGAGAFFRAAKRAASASGRPIALHGVEIDERALGAAAESGLEDHDLAEVQVGDFFADPAGGAYKAIVANPPYIRHHRLSAAFKAQLRALSIRVTGRPLDGRAGLHVYFLIRALELLDTDGRLTFIVPADTCEGVFARGLWDWIAERYRIEAVVSFDPKASPFPDLDTNPVILMIRKTDPAPEFVWAKCETVVERDLTEWVESAFRNTPPTIFVCRRTVREGLETGLSRPMFQSRFQMVLGDVARVCRGIATGCNSFFHLTVSQTAELGLPDEFLISAIGRTRDISGDQLTGNDLNDLEKRGRATRLFAPTGAPIESFPKCMQSYIEYGESLGLPSRSLISKRRPWYRMEEREVPPLLFAYLGRRNVRFILNRAGVLPLTGLLCVYPLHGGAVFAEQLWSGLRLPEALAGLSLVGKSYGGGAIKVEPRALERMPIDERLARYI